MTEGSAISWSRITQESTWRARHPRPPDAAPGGGHRIGLRRPLRDQGAPARRRRRHPGGQDEPPPLPAAALPGSDRHPLPGRDRAVDPRDPQPPAQRPGAARRGGRCRPRGPDRDVRRARPPHRDGVRLTARRRRGHPVLLRQRPLRRGRPRHEEHRRRPRAARAHLRRLRDGRARRQPRRERRPPADLRGGRRRPDRSRDGRPDRRACPPDAQARLPGHQHAHGPGDPARRSRPGAPALRRQAGRAHQEGPREARR